VFDIVREDICDLSYLASAEIVILAHSVDTCLVDGVWEIIGNLPVRSDVIFPLYKIETSSGFWVMNHNSMRIRPANTEEVVKLSNKKSYSPATIEHAAQANFGYRPWDEYYDRLVYLNPIIWVKGTY
jgi:hypothetical protein